MLGFGDYTVFSPPCVTLYATTLAVKQVKKNVDLHIRFGVS